MINTINNHLTDIGFGRYNLLSLSPFGFPTKIPPPPTTPTFDKSTDEGLSKALVEAYSGSASSWFGRDWAKDVSMMPWARAVMDFYSRDIPHKSSGSKWADRQDLAFFDSAVLYFKRFNYKKSYTGQDCQIMLEMIPAIDAEIQAVYARKAAGAYGEGDLSNYLKILNDLRQHLLITQAQLTCDKQIVKQESQEFLDQQLGSIQQAQTIVGQPSKGSKYLVYGLIGVAAVITVIIVLKA